MQDHKPKRVAIYCRVSTIHQTVENQLQDLRAVAERNGWRVVAQLCESGISGAKGRDQRSGFDELQRRAVRRDFDVVMVWAIDRIGRSVMDLLRFMQDLHALNIDLFVLQQALDSTTPSGRMTFGIFASLAEYERGLLRERIIAGQRRAVSQGTKIGRPSKMNEAVKISVRMLRERGVGIKEIAKKLEIGVGSVYNCLRA